MSGLSDGGGGLFEILDDFADLQIEMDWIGAIARAFRCKISIALGVGDAKARQTLLNWMSQVNREVGTNLISAQSALRRQGCLQSLDSQYHPFVRPSYFQKELAGLPLQERMKEMRKPDVKKRILAVDNSLWGKPFAAVIWNPGNLYLQKRLQNVVWCMKDLKTNRSEQSQTRRGVSPWNLIYDHIAQGGVLWAPLTGLGETFQ